MPTQVECKQAEADLKTLRAARLKMLAGGAIKSVESSSGKRVEFQPGKLGDIDREIARLQAIVDRCNGLCGGRRAIGVVPLTR